MNIYIGNLSYRVRESDLQQVLEEYGVVDSVKLMAHPINQGENSLIL